MIRKTGFAKWALCVALAATATSCIQDEELNTECDILSVTLPADILLRDPEVDNDVVVIKVKDYINVTALAPEFTLTEGATISPASGTVRDFTEPQKYETTSQDGLWHKTYTVYVEKKALSLSNTVSNMWRPQKALKAPTTCFMKWTPPTRPSAP